MKVLMFGWEFPPMSSGGLGTACQGLTKGLSKKGAQVTFVLPKEYGSESPDYVKIVSTEGIELANVKFKSVDSPLKAYIDANSYDEYIRSLIYGKKGSKGAHIYGSNLFDEVERYAHKAKIIAAYEDFDVIHAHDWLTYRAGIMAKQEKGKPLVVHVHATEFDRTGGNVNQHVYDIEREGMQAADKIIAVSKYTKNMVVAHYGIPESKIHVVHNAVEFPRGGAVEIQEKDYHGADAKTVLFLGRITLQKGPDYFLYAAKRVLDYDPSVRFIVAGTGDMMPFMINKAAELGISKNMLFSGFLTGSDVDRVYRMADLYVMPSVSEPFGITPLEAMRNGVPVIISKQSGVSEVLTNVMKVDFWDIDETANKIISALHYSPMHRMMRWNGSSEVKKFSWENSAEKCIQVYNEVISRQS